MACCQLQNCQTQYLCCHTPMCLNLALERHYTVLPGALQQQKSLCCWEWVCLEHASYKLLVVLATQAISHIYSPCDITKILACGLDLCFVTWTVSVPIQELTHINATLLTSFVVQHYTFAGDWLESLHLFKPDHHKHPCTLYMTLCVYIGFCRGLNPVNLSFIVQPHKRLYILFIYQK